MAVPRVLICEDSHVYASALRRMLEHDGDIAVEAVCGSAEEAIAVLRRREIDLLTMDVELPGMDGLMAVREIMSTQPMPILVLSSQVGPDSGRTAAALAAGAVDAVAKEDVDLRSPAGAAGAAFRQRVKMLSRAHVILHPHVHAGAQPAAPAAPAAPRCARVVGVCASTGGPQVLAGLLEALPSGYQIPVLVVQHMSAGFTDGLAHWLDQVAALPVRVARDGGVAGPGVWIAPDGAHLLLAEGGRLSLDRRTVTGPHRPSGNALFRSIAAVAGRAGVAVVLTGMGDDGAAGAAEVRRRGGLTIAQDEASSAIYGMPKVAADLGVDLVLPPQGIAAHLAALRCAPDGAAS